MDNILRAGWSYVRRANMSTMALWIARLALLIAAAVLILATFSTPSIKGLTYYHTTVTGGGDPQTPATSLEFGGFGYCVTSAAPGRGWCLRAKPGYSPAIILQQVQSDPLTPTATSASIRALVLVPAAGALAFSALITSLWGADYTEVAAVIQTLLSLILGLVALVCSYAGFEPLRNLAEILPGESAGFGTAFTLLACGVVGPLISLACQCGVLLYGFYYG